MNLIRINDELIINLDAVFTIRKPWPFTKVELKGPGPGGDLRLTDDEARRLWDRLQYLSTPLPAAPVATPDLAEIDETA